MSFVNRNIAIIWDFDDTLISGDCISQTVDVLQRGKSSQMSFWDYVDQLRGGAHKKIKKGEWPLLLSSDCSTWMFALSKLAGDVGVSLDREFFRKSVVPQIEFYPGVLNFLKKLKALQDLKRFQKAGLQIHHFVVSGALKHLIEECFPKNGLITYTFGSTYKVIQDKGCSLNVPLYAVDSTTKTRCLFEVAKGAFKNFKTGSADKRVHHDKLWCQYSHLIYVGDGFTDIPALSVVRDRGGYGVAVYNPKEKKDYAQKKMQYLSLDRRTNLITPADYSLKSELFHSLKVRCFQILQEFEALDFSYNRSKK